MFSDKINTLIKKELELAKKASIVIGVVTKNGRVFKGEIYDEIRDLHIGDYVFEMGSTTKTITSLLLAQLVQENIISLDEPIKTFKPEYSKALSCKGKEVTFRHLSTHYSGLPREDMKQLHKRIKENKHDKDNPYKYYRVEDLNQFFLDFDLKREIDKKWRYSNIAIGLLGNTLAEIIGVTYEEAVKSKILNPLGMKDTFITGNEKQINRYVNSYNKKGELIHPIEIPAMNGAGGLKSTMNDMLLYLEYQLGFKDSPLRESIEYTHKIQRNTKWNNYQMGLGWIIEQKKWSPYPIIHHGGRTAGFHTYCGFIKEAQIGVVIFSTIQLKMIRLIKILLNLKGIVNEDIAESIFKGYGIGRTP
ncbi:serine hydrolase domain-containing protein [Halalkalibacterium ligniniphilum]|uniref:serine hydrolase domain-containing protein n=1 Tax=Halalkalibacterium ligniniphilum TaxID=1134413 RepID=UPI00034A0F09|nr:serine hydrolase domain-containing protein [Halalkalibacterium ligniniphilum]